MADAASVLAPPDWTQQPATGAPAAAPPAAAPPPAAAADSNDPNAMIGMGMQNDLTGQVAAPPASPPADPQSAAQILSHVIEQMPNTAPTPDDEAKGLLNHLKGGLSKVSDLMAGDQTWHFHKDTDGNMTVTHDPATNKEKWGRIAAAVIGGAAKGMAAGQGPGGAAKAIGAGYEMGSQIQPNQEKQANDQAAADQKLTMAKANNAKIHQDAYMEMLRSKDLGTDIDLKSAAMLNSYKDALTSSPNATDYGEIGGEKDLMTTAKLHSDFLRQHAELELKAVPVQTPQGVKLHAVAADPGQENRKTTEPWDQWSVQYDPKTAEPTLKASPVDAGVHTYGQRDANHQSVGAQFLKERNDWTKNKAEIDKKGDDTPKTAIEARLQAELETDPAKKKMLTDAADAALKDETRLKVAGRNVNVGGGGGGIGMGGTGYVPGKNPVLDDTADGLASGRYLLKDLPKRTGKGVPTPQEQWLAANEVSQAKYGLPFSPTIIGQENTFANAPKTQAYLEGIDRMTGAHGNQGQLDQVLNLAQQAGIGESAPINEMKLAVKKRLGNDAAKRFDTLLTETQSNLGTLIGNPLLGSGESDLKLKTAQGAFGANPTLSNLKGQVATVKDVLERSRSNMAANNRYIQQRYGGAYSPGGQQPTPQPAAGGGTPAPAPQAGGQPNQPSPPSTAQFQHLQSDGKGNYVNWNGTAWVPLKWNGKAWQ